MAGHTFISYAHENTRFAEKLAHRLRKEGVSIWLDQWNLADEEDWERSIKTALREAHQVLLILSPDAVNSWLIRDQILLILREDKPIIPVLYQPCSLPPVLEELSWVDFTGRNQRKALAQLLACHFPNRQASREVPVLPRIEWRPLLHGWLARLLLLLWPGWLGPAIVLGLFIVSMMYYWSPARTGKASARPDVETLAVIRPTATPPLLPTPIGAKIRAIDGQIMVAVPAGEFLRGSSEQDPLAHDDEMPQKLIYVDAFWIDKTEITNIQYGRCVDEGGCSPPHPMPTIVQEEFLPVVGVDWVQADRYCRWVGGRLPTEAEWEKAARGTDGRLYPWGDTFDRERLNYCDVNCAADWRDFQGDDGYNYTAPVGSFPAGASPYGALDMSGNVWEWTADWYSASAYTSSDDRNPTGPRFGLQRVVRGGSWYYQGRSLRVVNRHKEVPTVSHDNVGFRCVVPEEPEAGE